MVGTAGYYAGKRIQEGQEEDAYRDARLEELEARQAPAAPVGGISDTSIQQLEKLGQLHDQGVLTDAEFEAQKQKVLQGV
jgi:hypothetical protein